MQPIYYFPLKEGNITNKVTYYIMLKQYIAQTILDLYINIKPHSLAGKVTEKIIKLVRSFLLRFSDPDVTYSYAGRKIILPFSHNLPVSKKTFPQYGDNLARIAVTLKGKYTDLKMIDIGANVGDTAILVNENADIPVLCIEGDEKFFRLLKKNTAGLKNIVNENSFVGDKNSIKGIFVSENGTGRIIEDEVSGSIEFKSLQEIVKNNPEYSETKLVKIDTDGFDCRIIKSSLPFLAELKPAIFFEYDPFFLDKLNDDGLSVFAELKNLGYKKFLFYDNTGDFILSADSNQTSIIEDLHHYYSGRNGEKYMDICALHNEDDDAAIMISSREIDFIKSYR